MNGDTLFVCSVFLLLSVLGNLYWSYMPFRLPWSVDTALTGIALFGVGFLAQAKLSEFSAEISLWKVLLFISVGICSLVFSNLNDFVNLAFNRLGSYFYFYAASISGIGICVMICQTIPPNRVFNYLGRNSLMILALHLPALTMLRGAQKFLLPNAWGMSLVDPCWAPSSVR